MTVTATAAPLRTPRKRLFVFLDGTWNEPASNTNVWRAHTMVLGPVGDDGVPQLCYYNEGMGNAGPTDYVLGGFFAFGLDQWIKSAYGWIMQHYTPDCDLFLFGFSRGAYMVRNLIGMIHDCGLLLPGSPINLDQLYDRYRAISHITPAPPTLQQIRRTPEQFTIKDSFLEYNMNQWSRANVTFRYVGIFDTVGAGGIPIGNLQNVSNSTLCWNEVGVNKLILSGRHALALDEHRFLFRPTLWTMNKKNSNQYAEIARRVEQRWFVGAHCNIGGGSSNDLLQQIPLRWIIEGAIQAGMQINCDQILRTESAEATASPIVNSLALFIGGLYQWIPIIGRPYYRFIGGSETDVVNINETIDASVFRRWQLDPSYRPRNLRVWADRFGLDLDSCKCVSRAAADGRAVSAQEVAPVQESSVASHGLNHPVIEKIPWLIASLRSITA